MAIQPKLKEIAVDWLTRVAKGDIESAYSEHIHEEFIHHNPYFEGSLEALMNAMMEDHKENPNLDFEIKQIVEEGDRVMSHAKVVKKDMEIAVVHIFRFEGEKIIELWDIGQVVDKTSPNEHGMF